MMPNGDWMETYTGRKFWPLDPRPKDVVIEDIAHSLSLLCRYNGHTKHFYSVAQHSLHCADLARQCRHRDIGRMELLCLLHDAAEAYVCDFPKPLKACLPSYKTMEWKVQRAIWQALRIDEPSTVEERVICNIDNIVLVIEAKQLMRFDGWSIQDLPGLDCLDIEIIDQRPTDVEREFLKRFKTLRSRVVRGNA